MSSLSSIEKEVTKLIEEVKNSININGTDLLKVKLSLQLNKVAISLRLTEQLMALYDKQEQIDQELLRQEVKDLSLREVLILNSVITKKIDNNTSKIDKILNSIKVSEIEAALLLVNNSNKDQKALPIDEEAKTLSLELLKKISENGGMNGFVESYHAAEKVMNNLEKMDDIENYPSNPTPQSNNIRDVSPESIVNDDPSLIDEDDSFLFENDP